MMSTPSEGTGVGDGPGLGSCRRAGAAFAVLLIGLLSLGRPAYPAPPERTVPRDAIVFRGGRVFDGEAVHDADVIIEDGTITAVGAALAVPQDATVVDARGRTLLPALIDAHVHAGNDRRNLARALVFGVALQVDLFGPPGLLKDLRPKEMSRDTAGLSDLRGAGVLATAPGGHGTEYGIDIPTLAAPEEAPAWVDARIAEGSDLIKIVIERTDPLVLSVPIVSALASAAHARGKQAWAHVATYQDAVDAVTAHVDGLAHLFADRPVTQALARQMAEQHVFVVPTLTVRARGCGVLSGDAIAHDAAFVPYLDGDAVRRLTGHKHLPAIAQPCKATLYGNVRALHDAGVRLLAGTDAILEGTAFGASLHGELALLVDAGLSPLEALRAATSAPADQLGLADRGRIRTGARGTVILVSGDPTTDITATRRIVGIWKNGVALDRQAAASAIAR
jgi:imidazolonepropionase-like amidohydrolase